MGCGTCVTKPSLLGAFHTGTVVFNQLLSWSTFGSLWGSPRGVILESFWGHSGVHFGDILDSILERKLDLSGTERIFSNAGALSSNSISNENSISDSNSNSSSNSKPN